MSKVNICYTERNIGIDLLKVWMAFEVVLCHFGHGSEEFIFKYFFSYFRSMAVPVFMIVSFYLSARFLVKEFQIYKLLQRLKRIYIPLIVWGIIYWIIYNAIAYCYGIYNLNLSFNDLVWQIFTGHSYNTAMWFNVVLSLLTIFFCWVCRQSAKYSTLVILLVSMLAIFIQSSGLNNVFMSYRNELNFPLGRIAEMIPFAGFGLVLYNSYANFFLQSSKSFLSTFLALSHSLRFLILFIFLSVIVGILGRGLSCSEIVTYHYSGIKLFLCSALLVAVFIFLPLQVLPKSVKKVITFLSRYSMGIYCVHMLVGTIMQLWGMNSTPLYFSVIVYCGSLLLCYGISKIPYKLFNDIVM